eukprot:1156975-Pelagomonas_calceolata.AAC.4
MGMASERSLISARMMSPGPSMKVSSSSKMTRSQWTLMSTGPPEVSRCFKGTYKDAVPVGRIEDKWKGLGDFCKHEWLVHLERHRAKRFHVLIAEVQKNCMVVMAETRSMYVLQERANS